MSKGGEVHLLVQQGTTGSGRSSAMGCGRRSSGRPWHGVSGDRHRRGSAPSAPLGGELLFRETERRDREGEREPEGMGKKEKAWRSSAGRRWQRRLPDDEARWRSTGRLLGLRSTAGGGMDADQQLLVLKMQGDSHGGWIGRRVWLAACRRNLGGEDLRWTYCPRSRGSRGGGRRRGTWRSDSGKTAERA